MPAQLTPEERNKLIQDNLEYARALAIKMSKNMPETIDLDDLVAYASKGLVEASKHFDPTRGVSFSTFSYYRIRGAIFDGLRQLGWLKKAPALQTAAATNSYLENIGDRPKPAVHSTKEETLQEISNLLQDITTIFITCHTVDPSSVEDLAHSNGFHSLAQKELRERLNQALLALSDRERQLIELYYFHDLSFEEVGNRMGLGKSWISRLHAKTIRRLTEAIQAQ